MGAWLFQGYRGSIFSLDNGIKYIMQEQQHFIDEFKQDVVSVFSTQELQKSINNANFDAIVVGSDQTWRPRNVPNVMDYWLEFASDLSVKRVAYAPSFGVDVWEYSEEQTRRCRKLAGLFEGLSVREESGVLLCQKYLQVEARHVLDPTMIWDKAFYASIAAKYTFKKSGCQCYFLDRTPEKETIANIIARKKKLSVNYINTRTEDANAPLKERVAPGIEKWLAGFMNGDFIVVDSFHAMVFSIIFEKPFIVIGNKRRGMSRFESLLGELGLSDRLLKDGDNLEYIIEKEICWHEANKKLNAHREKSISYIVNSLNL